jgi:hypothetical protein
MQVRVLVELRLLKYVNKTTLPDYLLAPGTYEVETCPNPIQEDFTAWVCLSGYSEIIGTSIPSFREMISADKIKIIKGTLEP